MYKPQHWRPRTCTNHQRLFIDVCKYNDWHEKLSQKVIHLTCERGSDVACEIAATMTPYIQF
jgi:hypothetical protein